MTNIEVEILVNKRLMFQVAFMVMDRGSAQQLLNLGRQLADSSLLRAALRELPADSPARSLIVSEIQELEA